MPVTRVPLRPEAAGVDWHIAMRPGKREQQKHTPWGAITEQAEKLKASVRANVRIRAGWVIGQFRALQRLRIRFVVLSEPHRFRQCL